MSRRRKEAHIADFSFVGRIRAEAVFLSITQTLHDEADRPQNDACDAVACPKGWLWIFSNVRRVQYGDGQANSLDLDYLEDPETWEGEEFVALVVEAAVLAGLDDAEEEEGGGRGPQSMMERESTI